MYRNSPSHIPHLYQNLLTQHPQRLLSLSLHSPLHSEFLNNLSFREREREWDSSQNAFPQTITGHVSQSHSDHSTSAMPHSPVNSAADSSAAPPSSPPDEATVNRLIDSEHRYTPRPDLLRSIDLTSRQDSVNWILKVNMCTSLSQLFVHFLHLLKTPIYNCCGC